MDKTPKLTNSQTVKLTLLANFSRAWEVSKFYSWTVGQFISYTTFKHSNIQTLTLSLPPVPRSLFPINSSDETEHKLRSEDVLVVSRSGRKDKQHPLYTYT